MRLVLKLELLTLLTEALALQREGERFLFLLLFPRLHALCHLLEAVKLFV